MKLYRQKIVAIAFIYISLNACASTQNGAKATSAESAYQEAMEQFNDKNYTEAITAFETLRSSYPFSKYAVTADFMIGECYFKDGKFLEAIVYYQEFIKLHPKNENAALAKLQIAHCFYKEAIAISLSSQFKHWINPKNENLPIYKDIANIEQAEDAYTVVTRDHPDSPQAQEARDRLAICRKNLARHHFYVGRFYDKQKDYYSALQRFDRIATQYPETETAEQALYRQGIVYLKLNDLSQASAIFSKLIETYPNSRFRAQAENQKLRLSK